MDKSPHLLNVTSAENKGGEKKNARPETKTLCLLNDSIGVNSSVVPVW